MPDISLQERRRYNDLVEVTDVACATDVRDIHTFMRTERNASVIGLYEKLYSDFDLLFILTGSLEKIKNAPEMLNAGTWLADTKPIHILNEKTILGLCSEGANIFIAYHNLLINQGYISLPGR
ncbi:hypothetical protein M0R72_15320 [Candidatus Pacearchaeota archaeon]|jgi:hypothetical protein|nr:hypothetical protein [Candidatus Pacearchaeota archaeon]